jgi:hypothetical protein
MCTYSVPFHRDGQFRGVTTVDIELEPLQRMLIARFNHAINFVIVTKSGNYVYHPDAQRILKGSILEEANQAGAEDLKKLAQELVAGHTGVMKVEQWDEHRNQLVFFAPISSTHWGFALRVSEEEAVAPVRLQLIWAGCTLGVLMLLIAASVSYVTTRLTAPILDLKRRAEQHLDG